MCVASVYCVCAQMDKWLGHYLSGTNSGCRTSWLPDLTNMTNQLHNYKAGDMLSSVGCLVSSVYVLQAT